MKDKIGGFSFIELIVGISISMILMISIGVLVSSGMKNITIQKQILDGNRSIQDFGQELSELLSGDFEIISQSISGITLKSYTRGEKPLYSKIEVLSQTGYCTNDESRETSQLKITRYNPFDLSIVAGYSGSYLRHEIYSGSTTIIGKGHFGDTLNEEQSGTESYLNTPSGITAIGGRIIVSDFGNHRIIYTSGGLVSTLLDEKDGILGPTGILYLAPNLYILNSGKKELIKVSSVSSTTSGPIEIIVDKALTNINRIDIQIEPVAGFTINGSYSTGDVLFSGITTGTGDSLNITSNTLRYTFDNLKNIDIGDSISLGSFSGTLSQNKAYYIKTSFYNGASLRHSQYLPYIVRSDGNLFTIEDNSLSILSGSLDYDYTILERNGPNIVLKDIIQGKQTTMNTNGVVSDVTNIPTIDINTVESNSQVLDFKIKSFQIDTTGNLLNIKIDYYKTFSCFNEKDSIIKTLLIKKSIP